MNDAINFPPIPDGNGGQAAITLGYDANLRANLLSGANNTANPIVFRVVGWDPNTGVADTSGNRSYALLLEPGQAGSVEIPTNNAAKSIQFSVNAKGKVVGFDTAQN